MSGSAALGNLVKVSLKCTHGEVPVSSEIELIHKITCSNAHIHTHIHTNTHTHNTGRQNNSRRGNSVCREDGSHDNWFGAFCEPLQNQPVVQL